MTLAARVMSPVWLLLWATLLSWSWLVPNHFRPWPSFHADALAGLAMSVGCAAVIVRSAAAVEWNKVTLTIAMLSLIPLLQLVTGLLPFAGQAWMSAAYMLGALVAVLAGQAWERSNVGQCADALFVAIGIGCIVSVGLQLLTWLGLHSTEVQDIWSMGLIEGRPYANLGQPNQLATLLLWGLLAVGWAYQNGKIGTSVATGVAAYLLLGVALTQSRTAWLGLTLIVVAAWFWRRHWKAPRLPHFVLGLYILFWSFPWLLSWLSSLLLIDQDARFLRLSVASENRQIALMMFAKAAMARPWFGYGWTEVAAAQMAVATELPGLKSVFGHSHNLFMDLVIWLGIPLGLLLSLGIVAAFVSYARCIRSANDLILVLFLGVIGIHAMLELPLHYAYFLLPTAMVVGMLNVRSGLESIWISSRWTLAALWLTGVLLYAGIVRDYFLVESNFQALRFERAGFRSLPVGKPPDVLLLTQLREQIRFMRHDFQPGMSATDIQWAKDVANTYPDPATIYRVASALAVNDQPQESQQWLRKGCKITTDEVCDLMRRAWVQDAVGNRGVAAVPWPN